MIDIINLYKSYGKNLILEDINLNIKPGKIFGLVGRSGEGKSTLLRCINALESIDSGEIVLDGDSVHKLGPKNLREMRKNVGMVFQDFSLVMRHTVFENVAIPLRCWGYDSGYIKKRVSYLLDIVGLINFKDVIAQNLSGGQKQRVAIARALALSPKVLLSDEATSSLDPNSTNNIIKLLIDINKEFNITEIIVTHEMDVVKKLCTDIAILENKSISVTGETGQIFLERPQSLKNLIGASDQVNLSPHGNHLRISYEEGPLYSNFISKILLALNSNIFIDNVKREILKDKVIVNNYLTGTEEQIEEVVNFCKEFNVEVEKIAVKVSD